MRQGVLVYDMERDRIDIRFGIDDYYAVYIVVHQWMVL